jgi:hypothetical protein
VRKLFLYDGQTYRAIADMVRCSFDDVRRYLDEGDVSVVEEDRPSVQASERSEPNPAGRATKYATEEERRQARLDQHKAYRERKKSRREATTQTPAPGSDVLDPIIAECIAQRRRA